MRIRTFQAHVAGLCVLGVLTAAAAQTPKPTVVKKGPNLVEVTVVGQGMDKDEALRDGKRKAVEYGAGTFIYSQSKTKDFVLIKDTVLARSAGFVQEVKVVSEKQTEDGVWELKLVCVVSVKGIEDTWGVVKNLLKDMGRPKIMVFIDERIDKEVQDSSTVQTRIENLLLKSGFLLVNREQLKDIDRRDIQAAIAEDKPGRVQAIAKRFGAQLYISGTAVAASGGQKVISGVGVHTYEAEANIKCYRSDTAQLLSAIPGKATRGVQRVGRSAAKQALDLQAQQVAPLVRADILRFWMDVLEGRGEVQLKVEGISFPQNVALKKALATIKQVKDVTATFSNSIAECSIESDVKAETLAEKIIEVFSNLEITDVSQNVIKARYTGE